MLMFVPLRGWPIRNLAPIDLHAWIRFVQSFRQLHRSFNQRSSIFGDLIGQRPPIDRAITDLPVLRFHSVDYFVNHFPIHKVKLHKVKRVKANVFVFKALLFD